MASLRKKPSPVPDVVVAADGDPAVAVAVNTNPAPAPASAPALEQDGASGALKAQIDALRQSETIQRQAQAAMLAAQERRQSWLQNNPLAQQHYAALNHLHQEALQSGLVDTSPQYFDFLNNRLATLQAQHPANAGKQLIDEMHQRAAQDRPPEPPPQQPASPRTNIVSAPVSREVPSSANGSRTGGKITLSREQLEAAQMAGVTPTEYARQLLRLNEMKASGEYSERR